MREVHLLFNRSRDIYTDYYYVYRSMNADVDKQSVRIMKIAQIKTPNPIHFKEQAKRINATEYQLSHFHIFNDKPVIIFINGQPLTNTVYRVDYEQGYIVFDEEQLETDKIEVEYDFDGIEVIDDYGTNAELDMNYYGPSANDKSVPDAPTNLSLYANDDGSLEVRFNPTTNEGTTFYYTVEARNDKGDRSQLSSVVSVKNAAHVTQYMIETSLDNQIWMAKGTVTAPPYIDHHADTEPPEGLIGVSYQAVTNDSGTDVVIHWQTPLANNKYALSPYYRVKAQLDNNNVSLPSSSVGPIHVTSDLDKIAVFRSEGTSFPVYNDPAAVKAGEITNYDSGTWTDHVEINKTYSYSLFVIDKAGNISIASTLLITT